MKAGACLPAEEPLDDGNGAPDRGLVETQAMPPLDGWDEPAPKRTGWAETDDMPDFSVRPTRGADEETFRLHRTGTSIPEALFRPVTQSAELTPQSILRYVPDGVIDNVDDCLDGITLAARRDRKTLFVVLGLVVVMVTTAGLALLTILG
jgi:hypothetical protein